MGLRRQDATWDRRDTLHDKWTSEHSLGERNYNVWPVLL